MLVFWGVIQHTYSIYILTVYIYIIYFVNLMFLLMCFGFLFWLVWFRFRFDFSILLIVFLWVDLSWFDLCNYVDLFALFCTYICFLCCKCSCLLLSKVESVSVKDFQLFTGNIMYRRDITWTVTVTLTFFYCLFDFQFPWICWACDCPSAVAYHGTYFFWRGRHCV